jgi:hypothetical protein
LAKRRLWLYLHRNICILIKVNLKKLDYLPFNLHYSESDSPFNFPEFSKSDSIAFPRLGLAYFYRKGLQRTGYSFILTNIVLGLNEKVVPFLIYPVSCWL